MDTCNDDKTVKGKNIHESSSYLNMFGILLEI